MNFWRREHTKFSENKRAKARIIEITKNDRYCFFETDVSIFRNLSYDISNTILLIFVKFFNLKSLSLSKPLAYVSIFSKSKLPKYSKLGPGKQTVLVFQKPPIFVRNKTKE